MPLQDKPETISLLAEEMRVDTHSAVTGKVRISTVMDEVEEIARLALSEDQVEVTRVPHGREVDVAPTVRTEGDTVIIPVIEEIMVVEKRLVLKEELHVRRHVTQETVEVPITLRKQRGVVERESAGGSRRDDEESIT